MPVPCVNRANRTRQRLAAAVAVSLAFAGCLSLSAQSAQRSRGRGTVTIGNPKIWGSDRLFTVLDGLLRDVDSITVQALQNLDPNSANTAEILSVVNDLQIGAKFDQAAAINARYAEEKAQLVRQADLDAFTQSRQMDQLVLDRRAALVQQLLDLQKQELDLVASHSDPNTEPLKTVLGQKRAVTGQITDLDTARQSGRPDIRDATMAASTTTTADQPPTGQAMKALPDELKTRLKDLLARPALPASIQMDNVIELLHQRLAREFAVMYDDVSRRPEYRLYMVQFDIGVAPNHDARDRQLRIDIAAKPPANATPSILAYELYPNASAYNTMQAFDKTSRMGISGLAQTLFGFGLAAKYNHERNELRSGLSQSLYVSAFGAGTSNFGWLIGPAPFDNFINPGTRTMQALLLVPRNTARIDFDVTYCWPRRETRRQGFWTSHGDDCDKPTEVPRLKADLPEDETSDEPRIGSKGLKVTHVSYRPLPLAAAGIDRTKPAAGQAEPRPRVNTVLITFDRAIDPNLTLTAGNKIIRRVRDVRGRALAGGSAQPVAGNAREQSALSGSRFGLLEQDAVDPDTWFQVDAKSALLAVSSDSAGADVFPVITIAAPGTTAKELTDLLDDQAEVRVDEFRIHGKRYVGSLLPLFYAEYAPGRIKAFVEDAEQDLPKSIRIMSATRLPGRASPVWLHDHAQVIAELEFNGSTLAFGLDCRQDEGTLSCAVPARDIRDRAARLLPHANEPTQGAATFPKRMKVWLDQPPYYGRPGLWADTDVPARGDGWSNEAYAVGEWGEVKELPCPTCPDAKWDRWQTSIRVANLKGMGPVSSSTSYCIVESRQVVAHLSDLLFQYAKVSTSAGASLAFATPDSRTAMQRQREKVLRDGRRVVPNDFVPNVADDRFLTIQIPFAALPVMDETLHLARCEGDRVIGPLVTLPDLMPRFVPDTVQVRELKGGYYRLEGDRLRSVNQVRIEGGGKVFIAPAMVGLNNVDFFVPKNQLKPGTYNLFIVIGMMTLPVMELGPDKAPRQASFIVGRP